MYNYGERFKELRQTKNISANKLSKLLNVDPSTISKIENGSAFPSIQLLEKLCGYFEITLYSFFKNNVDNVAFDVADNNCLNSKVSELLKVANSLSDEQIKQLINFLKTITKG